MCINSLTAESWWQINEVWNANKINIGLCSDHKQFVPIKCKSSNHQNQVQCRNKEFFCTNILEFDHLNVATIKQRRVIALIWQAFVSDRIMSVIQQLKDAGGITALETLLNETLIHTAPARIVFSSVGAGLLLSYIYSQLTHKVNLLSIFVKI